jgi:hypothetical protein
LAAKPSAAQPQANRSGDVNQGVQSCRIENPWHTSVSESQSNNQSKSQSESAKPTQQLTLAGPTSVDAVLSDPPRERLEPCASQFPRRHRIRIAKLKIGNHALAYLFGHGLARLLQGPVDIATHGIPELGLAAANTHLFNDENAGLAIDTSYPWPMPKSLLTLLKERLRDKLKNPGLPGQPTTSEQYGPYARFSIRTNVPNLYPLRAYAISRPVLIDVEGAICNLGYLPSLQEARSLLPGCEELRQRAQAFHAGFPTSPLVVHIRAGDILDEHNRLYKTMQPELVRSTAERLNRQVVFVGQLEDSALTRHLRLAFPDATFAHTGSAGLDFAIIRHSRFLLLSTSTFAWLAAWLSEESQCIVLPKTGMYSPEDAPEINLIDCGDRRFHFMSS